MGQVPMPLELPEASNTEDAAGAEGAKDVCSIVEWLIAL